MRRALILGCWCVVVACRPPAPVHPEDAPVELAALADAIDPGEQAPLSAGMPTWIADGLAATGAPAVQARDPAALAGVLSGYLRQLMSSNGQIDFHGLLTAISALGQVEADRRCDLACLGAAEQAYAILDLPALIDPDGFMGELLDLGVKAMSPGDSEKLFDVLGYLRAVVAAAPAHQHRIAARILREAPTSAEATQVLRDLARAAARDGDTAHALQWSRAVVERTRPASFDDVRGLTRACIRHLRLDCAIAGHARVAALAAGAEQHATVADEALELDRLRRVRAIGPGAALEPALERAHLLISLDVTHLATAELEQLRAGHPDDARPVVGLVRASFDGLRSRAAAALFAQARPLAHHDQMFYELALGMLFTRFMGELLPRVLADPDSIGAVLGAELPQLGEDVEGLARYAPARAAVLAIVIAKSQAFLPLTKLPAAEQQRRFRGLAQAALVEARALRVRYPDEGDTHRLALLLARFGGAARGDYAVVTDPLPAGGPDREQLALMRASMFVSLVVAWADADRLPALHAVVDALVASPATQDRVDDLRADVIALDGGLGGDAGAWTRAEAAYRARLAHAAKEDRSRLRNNLGVALWQRGAHAEAVTAWEDAVVEGDAVSVARLNLLATEPVTSETLAGLAQLGEQAERSSTRYQALRWHAARARLTGAALADAEAHARTVLDETGFGITVSGAQGVILDESFSFGLGYSSTQGLITNFALTSAPWLVVPAP